MSECISSCQNLENQQIISLKEIGEQGLGQIDQMYGTGYPAWRQGTRELSYHNGHHGRAVGEAALKLCQKLELSNVEAAVAQTAGFAHDLVQLKGRGVDEGESAVWLEAELDRAGIFPAGLRRMGALAIIGTEPLFENGQLVGQKATEIEYPSRSAEIVAKSVASGDFGEIYTPQGPYLAHQLFREIQGMPNENELPFEKMIPFQRNQIGLLERYHYPLDEAETILATHRQQVIEYSHETLSKLEDGAISSWDHLIERDQAFITQHS